MRWGASELKDAHRCDNDKMKLQTKSRISKVKLWLVFYGHGAVPSDSKVVVVLGMQRPSVAAPFIASTSVFCYFPNIVDTSTLSELWGLVNRFELVACNWVLRRWACAECK